MWGQGGDASEAEAAHGGAARGHVVPRTVARAAGDGNVDALRAWFRKPGRHPDDRTAAGSTCLSRAAVAGNAAAAAALVAMGAAPGAADARGWTPLHFASSYDSRDVVVLLLARGAAVDARDACGFTPLMRAAADGHRGVLRLLLTGGADFGALRGRATAASLADRDGQRAAAALLRGVAAAGGFRAYVDGPRRALLVLRAACERGRARPPPAPAVAARLFATAGPGVLPREVFWLVLAFWRTDRDDDA